jgi:hypothetical protein
MQLDLFCFQLLRLYEGRLGILKLGGNRSVNQDSTSDLPHFDLTLRGSTGNRRPERRLPSQGGDSGEAEH